MTFAWLNTWLVGACTSGSLALFELSRGVEQVEKHWSRRKFMIKSRHIVLPFEYRIDAWLKYCHVPMTAKQWYGLILGSLLLFVLFSVLLPSLGVTGEIAGVYFAGSVAFYPLQKRKKFNLDMEQQVQRAKRMLAKLYERNVHSDEMLQILIDALEEGQFKSMLEQAVKRTQTTDTLSEAIQWLSDEIQLPSLQALASVLVQGSHYANLPLDERLAKMAAKDREKTLINHEKLAEGKRVRALVEAGSFIALPLIGLLAAFVFYYVFQSFSGMQL